MARRRTATRCLALGAAAACLLAAAHGSAAQPAAAVTCPMSHVHYKPYPGIEQGLGPIPWVATAPGGRFKASLFFYEAIAWAKQHLLGARIFTTRKPRDYNPKVLWITRTHGYTKTLKMTGRRLDAPGSFSETYNGYGDYPSYVEVPAPGCWRVTVSTGSVSGSVVFSASD
jgi:hypothetical protein